MNKKILILIMSLPLVLMFVIFSVVQTVSINAPIAVTSVEITSGYDGFVYRYLDDNQWEDLQIEYTIYPVRAANQGATFSVTEGDSSAVKITEDGLVTKVTKEGNYKIEVKTSDGGYTDSIMLVASYKNPTLVDVEYTSNDIKTTEVLELDKRVTKQYILFGESVKIYATAVPSSTPYKTYQVEVEDSNIISSKCNSITGEITLTAKKTGSTKVTIKCIDGVNEIEKAIEIYLNVYYPGEVPSISSVDEVSLLSVMKETYYQGEVINPLDILIKYSDNTEEIISTTDNNVDIILGTEEVDSFSTSEVGSHSYTLTVQGEQITVSYQVVAVNDYKFRFFEGQEFDVAYLKTLPGDYMVSVGESKVALLSLALSELSDSDVVRTTINNNEIEFTVGDKTFSIECEVYNLAISEVIVKDNFNFKYYVGQEIQYQDYSVHIYYNDGTSTVISGSEEMFENLITSEVTAGTMNITYDSKTIEKEYSVNHLIQLNKTEYQTLNGSLSFTYDLYPAFSDRIGNNVIFYEIIKGSVNVNIQEGRVNLSNVSEDCAIKFFVEGYEDASRIVVIDHLEVADIDLDVLGSDHIRLSDNPYLLSVDIPEDFLGIQFEYLWEITSGNNLVDVRTSASTNYLQFIANKEVGIVNYKVTISYLQSSKTLTGSVEILDPVTEIGFTDSSKTYGIEGTYTIGAYQVTNNIITNFNHQFDIINRNGVVDHSKLIFRTSKEEIAKFNGSSLEILLDNGYYDLTIYAIVSDAVTLGIVNLDTIDWSDPSAVPTTSTYITAWKIRCTAGVEVTNSNELDIASNSTHPIVIMNDISVGGDVVTITSNDNGGYTAVLTMAELDAVTNANEFLKEMTSTADINFYIHGLNYKPKINYCLKFTTDVYGNGYTLDATSVTALSSFISNADLLSRLKWNGPLDLVNLLGISVKSQDNVCFIVDDNVVIDNCILQSYNDLLLLKDNVNDLTNLDYAGTVVEVMGDNVKILNSRIKNGRNCVRVYGQDAEFNVGESLDKINVHIESCIISNAREFLVKVGTNAALIADTKQEKVVRGRYAIDDLYKEGDNDTFIYVNSLLNSSGYVNDLFEWASPYLKNVANNDYEVPSATGETRSGNYLDDEDYMEKLVKTDLTLKNIVLANSGLFSIGLETKFAGPTLGGIRYNNYEGADWTGWYKIAGTSYPAVVRLVDNVDIYDWKNLANVDSSTLIQHGVKVASVFETLKFDIAGMMTNVKQDENYKNLIATINNDDYAHGGIALYGGGKNYSIVDTREFKGESFKYYTLGIEGIDLNSNQFNTILPWASGKEPFKFLLYDATSAFSYNYQLTQFQSNKAYAHIIPAQR